MPLLTLEHSRTAYRADFVFYGLACTALGAALVWRHPAGAGLALVLWVLGGMAAWTLLEYLGHRFLLHAVPPFKGWHAEHHSRPTALIAAPTLLTAGLFAAGAALPAWWLLGRWPAAALVQGLLCGYLVYGLTHHATHHAVSGAARRSTWLAKRRRWHAQHHAQARHGWPGGHYGVSTSIWDRVFGSDHNTPRP